MNKSRFYNFIYVNIGQLFTVLSQFIIIISLTRSSIHHEIASYGLITSIVIPITVFFNFDINHIILADNNEQVNFPKFIGSIFIGSVISLPIIYFFSVLFELDFFKTLAFTMFRIIINLKEAFYSLYQKLGYYKQLFFDQLIQFSTISIVFFIINYFYDLGMLSFFLCAILYSLSFLRDFYFLKNKKVNVFELDLKFYKEKSLLGINLGFNELLKSFKLNAPKYFSKLIMQNMELVGIITVYSQIITGLSSLNIVYQRLTLGRLGQFLKNISKRNIKKIHYIIMGNYLTIVVFGFFLFLIDQWVIGSIFGKKYTFNINIFELLLLIKGVTFPAVIIKVILINLKQEIKLFISSFFLSLLVLISFFVTENINNFLIVFLIIEIVFILYLILISKNRLINELFRKQV